MTEKEFLKGIEIPVECGKAECTERILILFQDMNKEQCGSKFNIYITEEDYNDKKPFTTVIGNMNPIIVNFLTEDSDEGREVFYWDLFDESKLEEGGNEFDIILSQSVDYKWNYSTIERDVYLSITPKNAHRYDGSYYVEKL